MYDIFLSPLTWVQRLSKPSRQYSIGSVLTDIWLEDEKYSSMDFVLAGSVIPEVFQRDFGRISVPVSIFSPFTHRLVKNRLYGFRGVSSSFSETLTSPPNPPMYISESSSMVMHWVWLLLNGNPFSLP